jgi:hypothetical protein
MMTLEERLALPDMQDLDAAQAERVLKAPDLSLGLRRVDVATADAGEIFLATGEWAEVLMKAENGEAPQVVRKACINLRDTILHTRVIRTTIPEIYTTTAAVLNGLVVAGVLSQETVDALLALAERPQSWAEANETEVTARTIGLARGDN